MMNIIESNHRLNRGEDPGRGSFVVPSINLNLKDGEFVSVLGARGSGKSTLLKIMRIMDEPNGGEYDYYEDDAHAVSNGSLRELRYAELGYISQEDTLDNELTVFENLEKPLIEKNIPTSGRRLRVRRMLERFHLTPHQSLFPEQLTPVLRRLVVIGVALVTNPNLIIADEPTMGLDAGMAKGVMELLKRLNRKGVTIVQATCSSSEASYGNRVIRLQHKVN